MKLHLIIFSIIIVGFTSCTNNTVKKNIEIDNYSKLDSILKIHRSKDENTIAPVFIENIAESIRGLSTDERK